MQPAQHQRPAAKVSISLRSAKGGSAWPPRETAYLGRDTPRALGALNPILLKGAGTVKSLSAAFLADLEEDWKLHGHLKQTCARRRSVSASGSHPGARPSRFRWGDALRQIFENEHSDGGRETAHPRFTGSAGLKASGPVDLSHQGRDAGAAIHRDHA
jgi:hypothetical protein